jgi:hypothetical protein
MSELVPKFVVDDRKICSFLPFVQDDHKWTNLLPPFSELLFYARTFDRYPEYDILGDPNVAKTAAVSTRYSDTSLNGIVLDIHFLSLSDYLVCTFSSQVCNVL